MKTRKQVRRWLTLWHVYPSPASNPACSWGVGRAGSRSRGVLSRTEWGWGKVGLAPFTLHGTQGQILRELSEVCWGFVLMVTLLPHRFPTVLSKERILKLKMAGRNHKKGGKWGVWGVDGDSQRHGGCWQPAGHEGGWQNWELVGRKKQSCSGCT